MERQILTKARAEYGIRHRQGDITQHTTGWINSVRNNFFISKIVRVLKLNVPLLISPDFMKEHKIIVDVGDGKLICKNGWDVLLKENLCLLYFIWENTVLYTTSELSEVHKKLYEHSERYFSFMRRAQDP